MADKHVLPSRRSDPWRRPKQSFFPIEERPRGRVGFVRDLRSRRHIATQTSGILDSGGRLFLPKT